MTVRRFSILFLMLITMLLLMSIQAFAQEPISTPRGDTVEIQPADDIDAILSVGEAEEVQMPETWYEQIIYYGFFVAIGLITLAGLLGVENVIQNGYILAFAILAVRLAWLTPWVGDDTLARIFVDRIGGRVVENEHGVTVEAKITATTEGETAHVSQGQSAG